MMSKKDAITLGVLAIGGIAVASAVAGGAPGSGGLTQGKPGGILGTYGGEAPGDGFETPTIYQIPAQQAVTFPEQPDYTDFLKTFLQPEPVSRGKAGVSAAPKKEVIYGGYALSGKTYVFGGSAFEAQAAKEVSALGYSPTLAASFGIKPEIAAGGGGTSKKSSSERSAAKQRSRERRTSSPEGGGF